MKGTYLGEFEELVMLTVASLDGEAYAVTVKAEIENHRNVNISAIHSALYRLEEKGFLTSEFGGATSKRGGKQKRYFKVTNAGFAELQRSKDVREQYWKTIPQLTFYQI